MCAAFVVRYHKFGKGLVQPTLYHFLGGAHDCLRKRTLKTTKVGTKKETTGSSSYPFFPVGEKDHDLRLQFRRPLEKRPESHLPNKIHALMPKSWSDGAHTQMGSEPNHQKHSRIKFFSFWEPWVQIPHPALFFCYVEMME
jgi:hypothetical protein